MKKNNKSKLHEKKVIKEVLKYISKKINQPDKTRGRFISLI